MTALTIPLDAAKQRFDRWLRQTYPQLTQGIIEKSLRKGLIRLDRKKVPASHRLVGGEEIQIAAHLMDLPPHAADKPVLKPLSSEEEIWLESLTIWEDEELLVLNKPSGLAVQGGTKTLRHVDGLLQAYGAPRKQRYRLVHRLDRDTSGVLLIAKSSAMARHLTNQFRLNQVKKQYLAVVLGLWNPHQGTISAPLVKIGATEKMIANPNKGREAITHFRLVKYLGKKLSLVAFTPETGRTHQLRVHAQYQGYPIIGDGKYGGEPALKASPELHLHAYRITIEDLDNTPLTFTAPLPEHFFKTVQRTDNDLQHILVTL